MKFVTPIVGAVFVAALAVPAQAAPKHHHSVAQADAIDHALQAEAPDQAAAEGYRRASGFDQVKAQCELVANQMPRPGYFVMGSPTFVGASSLGYGIGSMIRHAQDYEHCMTLHGYVHQ
jgi:hypothetical protein